MKGYQLDGTIMLNYELIKEGGFLVLRPGGALDASDFEAVAAKAGSVY
jgi:hypothetical protein